MLIAKKEQRKLSSDYANLEHFIIQQVRNSRIGSNALNPDEASRAILVMQAKENNLIKRDILIGNYQKLGKKLIF